MNKLNIIIENKNKETIIPLSIINIYASSETTPCDPKTHIHLYYCITREQGDNKRRVLKLLVVRLFKKLL